MITETAKVGKRGTIVIPAALRQKYGLEEGSQFVVEEAKRNLDRQEQQDALNRLLSELRVVPEADPRIPCPVPLPEKDRPVLMAALSCEADHLVTGEVTHFGKYNGKVIQGIRICAPRDFFNAILRRTPGREK